MTDMDHLYRLALAQMDWALNTMLAKVPPARKVPYREGFVFRFVEQSIHQAILQKLARIISGLSAASTLLENGFLQEQAAIQRMLDELQEDVGFLSYAAIDGNITELHRRYIADFYQEEFEATGDPVTAHKPRAMIPRKKIRAYLSSKEFQSDPSTGAAQLNTLGKAYSGYIHGASPHIMEMYDGFPPRFHVFGMRGSPLFSDHQHDLWNYYYRGLTAFGIAAHAFGAKEITGKVTRVLTIFERTSEGR